jgi:hypothetical protein
MKAIKLLVIGMVVVCMVGVATLPAQQLVGNVPVSNTPCTNGQTYVYQTATKNFVCGSPVDSTAIHAASTLTGSGALLKDASAGTAGVSAVVDNGTDTVTVTGRNIAVGSTVPTGFTPGSVAASGSYSTPGFDPVVGTTILTNGNFPTGTCAGWTCATGWVPASGSISHTPGNIGSLTQVVTVVNSYPSVYQLSFVISAGASGTLDFQLGTDAFTSPITALDLASSLGFRGPSALPRTYIGLVLTLTASGAATLTIRPSTDFNGTLSDITLGLVTRSLPSFSSGTGVSTESIEIRRGGRYKEDPMVGGEAGQYLCPAARINTFVGGAAGWTFVNGRGNTWVGSTQGVFPTHAFETTALGAGALGTSVLPRRVTALGDAAGSPSGATHSGAPAGDCTTCSDATFVGSATGLVSTARQHTYFTIIGAEASGDCDNCVVLGRSNDRTITAAVSNGITTATNSDNRGHIALVAGTGSYTFTKGPGAAGIWTTAPVCIIQDDTTMANIATSTKTVTATSLTITGAVGLTDVYSYICWPGN